MLIQGYIEVGIYKHRIEIRVRADYSNQAGQYQWLVHYYYLEYRHRIWRWLLSGRAIKQIKRMSKELSLPIKEIFDFRVLNGDSYGNSSIKQFTIFDINNTKG